MPPWWPDRQLYSADNKIRIKKSEEKRGRREKERRKKEKTKIDNLHAFLE
jgi:hypothetical protein